MQDEILALQQAVDRLTAMLDGYGKLDAEYALMERRAEAAEAEVKRLNALIDQYGSAKLIRLSGGTSK